MLSNFQTLVNNLVRDEAEKITPDQLDLAISGAVLRYSKDKPLLGPVEVIATGSKTLALPPEWADNFSTLQDIEYPVDQIPARKVSSTDYEIRRTPSGNKILCLETFTANEKVWLHITRPHTVTSSQDTIPEGDREAICALAAASLLDQLAVLYSGDSDSTINADSVNHQSKAGEYASRARNLRKRYFDELGVDDKRTVSACEIVNLNASSSVGRDRLTHPNRYR